MSANDKQVGGDHYRTEYQHWDFAIDVKLGYFTGQVTKYVSRWRKKNGIQDLQKAAHFLQKYIEDVLPKQNDLHINHKPWIEVERAIIRYFAANSISGPEAVVIRLLAHDHTTSTAKQAGLYLDGLLSVARKEEEAVASAKGMGYVMQG